MQIQSQIITALAHLGYKRPIFNKAREVATRTGKPLLNVGCGSAYTKHSDVNLDIRKKEVPNFVRGDIQDLSMFKDKEFGAVFASHVIEHTNNPDAALSELHRVADNVFLITPLPFWPSAWLGYGHKWLFWKESKICKVPKVVRYFVRSAVLSFLKMSRLMESIKVRGKSQLHFKRAK